MSRIQALLDLAQRSPGDPFVWYGIALEYKSAGNHVGAEETFHKLLEEFPDYIPAYVMAGQFYAERGRTEEAREVFQLGIAKAKSKGDSHAQNEMQDFLDGL